MNSKRLVLSFCVVAAMAAATLGFVQSQYGSGLSGTSKMVTTSSFAGASTQDIENFATNLAKGTNLPTSITTLSNEGTVTARLTDFVMYGTNERQVTITVADDPSDLTLAQVYLDGQILATATVQNGGIVVRGPNALATLSVLIPPAGQAYDLEVQWTASDTFVRSVSLQASL